MFASDARRGTPWEILTPDQIQAHSRRGGQRVHRFRALYAIIYPELLRFQWNAESAWQDG